MERIDHSNRCCVCKLNFESSDLTSFGFVKKPKHKYRRFICRPCNSKKMRVYYANSGKENIKRSIARTTKKYKFKQEAREILNTAVSAGKVKKPNRCEMCFKEHNRIEGHHDDYTQPLSVVWACPPCHAKIHKQMKVGTLK